MAAVISGNSEETAKLVIEGAFGLKPGGFESEPSDLKTIWYDNLRTLPLMFAAAAAPPVTCDMLESFTKPAPIMTGENTRSFFSTVAQNMERCLPNQRKVVLKGVTDDGPVRDPKGFGEALLEFVSEN